MYISEVRVHNFRGFNRFAITVESGVHFIIGECSIGKSSLLAAICRGLGKDRNFERDDFFSVDESIEIEIDLMGLSDEQIVELTPGYDFVSKVACIGVRVTWDSVEEEPRVEHGYPKNAWSRTSREARNSLPVQFFSSRRHVERFLAFGHRRNLIGDVLETLSIEPALKEAIDTITGARTSFGESDEIRQLCRDAEGELSGIMLDLGGQPQLRIDSADSSDLEVLRSLGLAVERDGRSMGLAKQSDGLIQLLGFSFITYLAKQNPGSILLLDQPEESLHPQPQRALAKALQGLPNQTLLVTHSSNLLDRADPRKVRRLFMGSDQVIGVACASGVTEEEATNLARYSRPDTAESFFARTAILVEGLSDKFALEAASFQLGYNLDAAGVSIVSLDGAGTISSFLRLLGPDGLKVRICGLCDKDKEDSWIGTLNGLGIASCSNRQEMEAIGFFVSDLDLEYELIEALGEAQAEAIIDALGETGAFNLFCQQPKHSSKARKEQIRGFLRTKGRKIKYAPRMIDGLDPSQFPSSIMGILNYAYSGT